MSITTVPETRKKSISIGVTIRMGMNLKTHLKDRKLTGFVPKMSFLRSLVSFLESML